MAATAKDVRSLAFTLAIGAAVFAPLLGGAMATGMSALIIGWHVENASYQLD